MNTQLFQKINHSVAVSSSVSMETKMPVRGQHKGQGMLIEWKGSAQIHGADPVNVLVATAQRLEHLQTTALGNGMNAKALFKVLEAIDILAGTNEVSGDPLDASQLAALVSFLLHRSS